MKLETEIMTPKGLCRCRLERVVYECTEAIEVDLWHSVPHLDNSFVDFSACVYMKWDGIRYRIVQPSRGAGYTNDLWRELEVLLSNLVMVNE